MSAADGLINADKTNRGVWQRVTGDDGLVAFHDDDGVPRIGGFVFDLNDVVTGDPELAAVFVVNVIRPGDLEATAALWL